MHAAAVLRPAGRAVVHEQSGHAARCLHAGGHAVHDASGISVDLTRRGFGGWLVLVTQLLEGPFSTVPKPIFGTELTEV